VRFLIFVPVMVVARVVAAAAGGALAADTAAAVARPRPVASRVRRLGPSAAGVEVG
jgi:hypothetical protein